MPGMDDKSVMEDLRTTPAASVRTGYTRWLPSLPCSDLSVARLRLRETIEDEIIPRLVLSHRTPSSIGMHPQAGDEALLAAALELADCADAGDSRAARAVLDRLLEQDTPVERIFLKVMSEAACELGRRWERDTVDFLRVALATGCLQSLLREIALDHQHETAGAASDRRILLVTTPGETHSFGIAMVAEIFRRRGWHVDSEAFAHPSELSAAVHAESYDVIGLSLSSESRLPVLAECIRQVRVVSRNRRIGVMVGGPLFSLHPDWMSRVGADSCSHDALHAIEQAEQLVGLLVKSRC